jgi:hypothetical protein
MKQKIVLNDKKKKPSKQIIGKCNNVRSVGVELNKKYLCSSFFLC